MNPETGKYIVFTGIVIVVIGLLIYIFHDKMQWIGRLPGDIRVEKEHVRFYFPVTTMILFSIVVGAIIWVAKKIM